MYDLHRRSALEAYCAAAVLVASSAPGLWVSYCLSQDDIVLALAVFLVSCASMVSHAMESQKYFMHPTFGGGAYDAWELANLVDKACCAFVALAMVRACWGCAFNAWYLAKLVMRVGGLLFINFMSTAYRNFPAHTHDDLRQCYWIYVVSHACWHLGVWFYLYFWFYGSVQFVVTF